MAEEAGQRSRLFNNWVFPFDGKSVVLEIADAFTQEFNEKAYNFLEQNYGTKRAKRQPMLSVASAYPTQAKNCPRIAVIRQSTQSQRSGMGRELETKEIEVDGEKKNRVVYAENCTDTVELSLCTQNEQLRDEVFVYLHQYFLDAAIQFLPELSHGGAVYALNLENASDDQVEFQGGESQPGFQFFISRLVVSVEYELLTFRDVDQIAEVLNFQYLMQEGELINRYTFGGDDERG